MTEFWFVPEIHKSQGWPRLNKRRDIYLPKKVGLRFDNPDETIRNYFDSLKFGVRRWEMFRNEQSLMITSRRKEAELLVIGRHKYGKLISFDEEVSKLVDCVVIIARNYRGYGSFECKQPYGELCNEWGSPHAFRNTFQMCKECHARVISQDRRRRKNPSQLSHKRHLDEFCERCRNGKPCMSNRVAVTGFKSQQGVTQSGRDHVYPYSYLQFKNNSEDESESDDDDVATNFMEPENRYPSSSENRRWTEGRRAAATNDSNRNARTKTEKDSMSGAGLAGALAGGAAFAYGMYELNKAFSASNLEGSEKARKTEQRRSTGNGEEE